MSMDAIVISLTMLFFLILILLIPLIVDWLTHKSMTKGNSEHYGYAGYKEFVKQFNQVEWEYDQRFNGSLFTFYLDKEGSKLITTTDQYHASIIQFNGDGMIIHNPFSYFLVWLYVRRYIRDNHKIKQKKEKNMLWRNSSKGNG